MTECPLPSPGEDLERELSVAATFGDLETIRRCLDAGADVNQRDKFGMTPMILAGANGGPAVARLLLERGARAGDANLRGITALFYFVSRGDVETALLLLDHGATLRNPDNGPSILHQVVLNCSRKARCDELVRRLLALGADPHAPNAHGVSPAQFAQTIGYAMPISS